MSRFSSYLDTHRFTPPNVISAASKDSAKQTISGWKTPDGRIAPEDFWPVSLRTRRNFRLARDLEIDVNGTQPEAIIVTARRRPSVKRWWLLAHCQSVVPDV